MLRYSYDNLINTETKVDESEAIMILKAHGFHDCYVDQYDSGRKTGLFTDEGEHIAEANKLGEYYSHEILFFLE